MKVRVVRELVEGRYQVSFQVDDFTAEEVKKMSQFGTPAILIQRTVSGQSTKFGAPITQLPPVVAAFPNEAAAKAYETDVLSQLKLSIDTVRSKVDKFTSSEEIAL